MRWFPQVGFSWLQRAIDSEGLARVTRTPTGRSLGSCGWQCPFITHFHFHIGQDARMTPIVHSCFVIRICPCGTVNCISYYPEQFRCSSTPCKPASAGPPGKQHKLLSLFLPRTVLTIFMSLDNLLNPDLCGSRNLIIVHWDHFWYSVKRAWKWRCL